MKNYGFNIKIKYKDGTEETRNNVTEIHYNYNDFPGLKVNPLGRRVAFESDIHGTGGTVEIDDIQEFEATIAPKKGKEY